MNTGSTINLEVEPNDSIAAVKKKVHEQEGYDLDSFAMVFAGKVVGFNPGAESGTSGSDPADDEKTLAEHGIAHECVLHGLYKLF